MIFNAALPAKRAALCAATPRMPRHRGRRLCVTVRAGTERAQKVLIVNTKKGGHAFVGLYLATELQKARHTVTILNDGDSSIESKAPFSEYKSLQDVSVVYGDPADPSTYPQGDFDIVYDNNGKSMQECQALIDTYAPKVKQYCFVGSAGAYEANASEPMHVEGDARKASAGHKKVEDYLEQVGAPFTVFHPLYMYGAHTAKDCEQWFIERIIRDRPVPIPAPGVQLTSVSHVEDVAAMMAAAAGVPAALRQHYNACTDRAITLDGLATMVADALGKRADIVHYNVKDFDIPKGKGFPFRTVHFFASTDKAKRDLGWAPRHVFADDLSAQIELYKQAGREQGSPDFSVDDMILAGAR